MTDVQAALEAHIASARRHGATRENALRAGRLFLRIIERRAGLEAVKAAWEAALAKLERQGAEGKAAALELRLELLSEAVEAAQLRPGHPFDPDGKAAGVFEGKALRDAAGSWPSVKARAFARLIRQIGGYSADGRPAVHPLDFDDAHFERATSLIRAEVAPESAAERKALARWQRDYPGGEAVKCERRPAS